LASVKQIRASGAGSGPVLRLREDSDRQATVASSASWFSTGLRRVGSADYARCSTPAKRKSEKCATGMAAWPEERAQERTTSETQQARGALVPGCHVLPARQSPSWCHTGPPKQTHEPTRALSQKTLKSEISVRGTSLHHSTQSRIGHFLPRRLLCGTNGQRLSRKPERGSPLSSRTRSKLRTKGSESGDATMSVARLSGTALVAS
jgi:hypothetical protein